MSSSNKYSPEVRERAVRMVLEHQGDHDSQWAAIGAGSPISSALSGSVAGSAAIASPGAAPARHSVRTPG